MLPEKGTITLNQVRTELEKTGKITLNDTDVRKLAEKTSGTIKMSDLHGKGKYDLICLLTVGTPQANYYPNATFGMTHTTDGDYGKLEYKEGQIDIENMYGLHDCNAAIQYGVSTAIKISTVSWYNEPYSEKIEVYIEGFGTDVLTKNHYTYGDLYTTIWWYDGGTNTSAGTFLKSQLNKTIEIKLKFLKE